MTTVQTVDFHQNQNKLKEVIKQKRVSNQAQGSPNEKI